MVWFILILKEMSLKGFHTMNKKNVQGDTTYSIDEFEVDPSWEKDFGEKYFEYRRRWEKAKNDNKLYDFPLFLEVDTLNDCNYKCPACPAVTLNSHDKNKKLPEYLIEKLIAECEQERLHSITLDHGSEPLMNRNITNIILQFKEIKVIDIFLHTNGSLLTKEVSRQLIQNGLTKINFSLDAVTPETYSRMRVGGNYDRVLDNIMSFLEVKQSFGKSYPRTRVSFVCTDENENEREAFFDFWKDKVNVIAFQGKRDYRKIFFEKNDSGEHKGAIYTQKGYKCNQLWQLLVVDSNGDILPCLQDYKHQYVLGNLKDMSIKEAWHSQKMNKLRGKHLNGLWHKENMCSKCVSCRYEST